MKERILLISTHPFSTNGYSNVLKSIINALCTNHIVIVYGFHYTKESNELQIGSDNVIIYNVQQDFGLGEIKQFVKLCHPSKILLYNDPYVVYNFLKEISQLPKTFEIIVYLDLVYKNSRKVYIEYFNNWVDKMIVFLNCWCTELNSIGYTKSINVVHHCPNSNIVKLDQLKCQQILKINPQYIYILNMNRNTPRKRYDILIKGLAEFYKKNPASNLKVIFSCDPNNTFDLYEIMNYEELNTDNVIFIKEPSKLTYEYVNYLYNASDIGINTCDGEGFGLCNFEHAYIGKPQIVPNHDSLMEIYENNVQYVKTKISYYNDNTRDALGGVAWIPCYESVAKCIENYMNNELRINDGKNLETLLNTKYNIEQFDHNMNKLLLQ